MTSWIHGNSVVYKRCKFQAHMMWIDTIEKVDSAIESIQNIKSYQGIFNSFPYAYRILENKNKKNDDLSVQLMTFPNPQNSNIHPSSANVVCHEGGKNGNDFGAYDKLIHFLQRFNLLNCLLLVTCEDDSVPGQLGLQKFKIMLSCCKSLILQNPNPQIFLSCSKNKNNNNNNNNPSNNNGTTTTTTATTTTTTATATKRNVLTLTIPLEIKSKQVLTTSEDNRIHPFQWKSRHSLLHSMTNNKKTTLPKEDGIFFPLDNLPLNELITLGISHLDLAELKSLRQPPKELHLVLICLSHLLNSRNLSWVGCKEMIAQSKFCTQVLNLQPQRFQKEQIDAVRNVLQEKDMMYPERIRRITIVGADLLTWVLYLVDQYDQLVLKGFRSKKTSSSASLQQEHPLIQTPQTHAGLLSSSSPITIDNKINSQDDDEDSTKQNNDLASSLTSNTTLRSKEKIVDRGRMIPLW